MWVMTSPLQDRVGERRHHHGIWLDPGALPRTNPLSLAPLPANGERENSAAMVVVARYAQRGYGRSPSRSPWARMRCSESSLSSALRLLLRPHPCCASSHRRLPYLFYPLLLRILF